MTIADDLRALAQGVDGLLQERDFLAQQLTGVQADRNAWMRQADSLAADLAETLAALQDCRNPRPRVVVGVNEGGAELEPALGIPLGAVRVFDQTDVDAFIAAGKEVYLSVRTVSDVPAVVDRYAGEHRLTLIVRHEPEDDNDTTPMAFQAEQREAARLVAGRLRFAPCLMAATWTKGQAGQWIAPDVPYDALCVDGYLREIPWTALGFERIFRLVIEDAAARGLPLAITEVGVPSRVDASTSTEQAQAAEITRLHSIAAGAPGIEAVCYFHESVTKDKTRDYRFTARPLVVEAFRAMVTDEALR